MTREWRTFVRVFAATTIAALVVVAGLIALIDPLAISPFRVISDEVLPRTNRRFIAPAIVRSGRFDGFVIGSSTVSSLDPKSIERVLPGRFANLSLYASMPYEQSQLVRLIVRERPQARAIIWGLDTDWCTSGPLAQYASEIFPEWLYRPRGWSYIAYAFNWASLELAQRKIMQLVSGKSARLRSDGYVHILPSDAVYDPGKAQRKIYGSDRPPALEPEHPTDAIGAVEGGLGLPGLVLLRNVLTEVGDNITLVLLLMPRHAFGLPAPGSPEWLRMRDCKAAIAWVAGQRGAWVIDAMWRSPWTVDDHNYWDPSHFRDNIAEGLIAGIDAAVNRGSIAPGSALRLLARGRGKRTIGAGSNTN
jgi:hypothetical protein